MNDLLARGRTAYQKASATHTRSGAFTLLLGVALLALAVAGFRGEEQSRVYYFFMGMALLFCAWGVSQLLIARRYMQK
jgi:hypothetical protein